MHTFVSKSRAAQNRDDLDGEGGVANGSTEFALADLLSFEVFLHDAFITVGHGFQKLVVVLPSLRYHTLRNRFDSEFGP